VTRRLGAAKVQTFVRTYFVPGMFHCFGGTGPSVFDGLTPLLGWVEKGETPKQIIATQPAANGALGRSRPLCPYPQVASYKGAGSVDAASSFECRILPTHKSDSRAPT